MPIFSFYNLLIILDNNKDKRKILPFFLPVFQASIQNFTLPSPWHTAFAKHNPLDYNLSMHTIAELPQYIKRAERLLSEHQRQEVIDFLAENPDSGVLIRGTGGIRKLRWGREGMGKSGGVRVIYYFHNETIPLYLLTVFGKGEKSNLSKAEEHALTALVKVLLEHGRQQR